MKVGDRVRCTFSTNETYTQGYLYPILGFDNSGTPIIEDNDGDGSFIGQPLDGVSWRFELVDEQQQTEALLQLLQMSQKDVEEGRFIPARKLLLKRRKED